MDHQLYASSEGGEQIRGEPMPLKLFVGQVRHAFVYCDVSVSFRPWSCRRVRAYASSFHASYSVLPPFSMDSLSRSLRSQSSAQNVASLSKV